VRGIRQSGFIITMAILAFLCEALPADPFGDYPEEERLTPKTRVLKPKRRASNRSPQLLNEGRILEYTQYDSSPKFSVGVFLFQNAALSSNSQAMPMNGSNMGSSMSAMTDMSTQSSQGTKDPDPFGLMESATVLNARLLVLPRFQE